MEDAIVGDLSAWVERRDEAAFRRLVERHMSVVSAACRRQLGDGDDADEATQAVFILLARRAGSISNPRALPSWLYATAQRVCRHARRAATRRTRHEQTAAMHSADSLGAASSDAAWADLRPMLDDAIQSLSAGERAVVVGHFLHGLSQAAMAERLGISENAACKRVGNAVVKLRAWFSRRQVSVGAGVLVAGMMSEASAADPALAAACAQASLNPAAATGAAALAASASVVGTAKIIASAAVTLVCASAIAAIALPIVAAARVDTSASPASRPAAPPHRAEVILRYDFEDGLRPAQLKDGEVVAGPSRNGSSRCLAAKRKLHDGIEMDEAVLVDQDMKLATYHPGTRLVFECLNTGTSDRLYIYLWDVTRGDNARLSLPQTVHGVWTHVDVCLDDFHFERDAQRSFTPGDRIGNLAIGITASPGSAFYIDDLVMMRP